MEIRYKCETPEELWGICKTINKCGGTWSYKKYTEENIRDEWHEWKGIVYIPNEGFTRTKGFNPLKCTVAKSTKEFYRLSDLIVRSWSDSKLTFKFLGVT